MKTWNREGGTALLPAYRAGFDLAGAFASGACAVHCALLPLLPVVLPGMAAGWLEGRPVHALLGWVVLCTSALAFVPGWIRHGEARIWNWVVPGLGLIGLARFWEGGGLGGVEEAVVTTLGGVLLLVAHRLNHSLSYWAGRDLPGEAASAAREGGHDS